MQVANKIADFQKDPKIERDLSILMRFIQVYCDKKHTEKEKKRLVANGPVGIYINDMNLILCNECTKMAMHGASKRVQCPYDPKPRCKKCPNPCYARGYRENIKRIMRFSGLYLIKHGKLHWIFKYFF